MNKKGGFTLIEMAMVLVIIGILVSIGAGMLGSLTKRAKNNETKDILDGAVESITGFGASNNRIPAAGAEFASVVRTTKDSWGNQLYYIPDANLVTILAGGICGRKSTSLSVVSCPDAGCAVPTSTTQNVAFVVLSGGENFNIQTASIANSIKVYDQGVNNVDDYAADMNRPEPYDDIVRWITLDELRIKAGCTGTQLRQVNSDLPSGRVANVYGATVFPDGGAPYAAGGKYRWCVQGTLPAGITIIPNTVNANCAGLAEASWGQSDTLGFSGSPAAAGSFNVIVFVRDNNDPAGPNDNIAQRSYVITVSP